MIKKTINLSKKPFVRNVATVTTGTAVAQLITVAFAPIITRLYGPEAYGILGVFMSIVAILGPIAAMTYPIAIVLPANDSDARKLVWLSLYVAFVMAGVISLVLFSGHRLIVNLLRIEVIAPFLFLIPLVVLFSAYQEISQQWLIRKKRFKMKARVKVAQAFIVNGSKAGIGLFYPVVVVLVIIYAVGQLLYACMLSLGVKCVNALEATKIASSNTQQASNLKELAYCYRDFPFYRAPQVFINAISQNLPVLILAGFFGPVSAGFYAICGRVLKLPSHLVAKSVGDVFYPRINEAKHKGENITRLIVRTTLSLAVVGFLPFIIVVFFGPQLFEFIFGAEWKVAGQYARWLALFMFFNFINKPSVGAIPVLRIQRFFLKYEVLAVFTRIVALLVGIVVFKDDIIAVAFFSVTCTLSYIFLILQIIFKSRK